ncbi:MAG: GNAT family N-acetyltransferase [Methanobacteriota archaeon]|nr:MAG: GNAT family N-acetyltransferase [Euryarchaeota archaeon]
MSPAADGPHRARESDGPPRRGTPDRGLPHLRGREAALVAREKRAVVGVALAVYSPSAEEGRLLVLNDFFVDPAMRRKGVGRALATRLLEEAKAMRVERIDLEVTPTNAPAAAFWKSMGFRTGGRTVYGRDIV